MKETRGEGGGEEGIKERHKKGLGKGERLEGAPLNREREKTLA